MPTIAGQRTPACLAAVILLTVSGLPLLAQGTHRIGGGVSAPTLIHKVDPEFAEEARTVRLDGTVVVYIVVDEEGIPRDLKVVRPLGMGLDEKALEAVSQWRFRPGMKDGEPVRVAATVEVNFRLPKEPEEEK